MLPENIIFLAVSITLLGHFFYIKSIIRGHTRPNLVSWSIWMIAPFLGAFFQVKAGAGLSALPIFIAGFGSLVTIIAAVFVRNAFWKITTFDIYCGLLSLIALTCYILTQNLGFSILFAIMSDALAFMPTYKKAWKFPETENHSTYSFPILPHLIGLMIIKNWSFTIYSFNLYFLIANIVMVFIIFRKKIFRSKILS